MTERYVSDRDDRLDKVLNDHVPRSRTQLQEWIEHGRVRVNDDIVTSKSHSVSEGDELELDIPEVRESSEGIVAEAEPLNIIHEDDSILVLNKPAGLIVHPTESIETGTLANRLVHHYPRLASVGPDHRAGLAHRLDRGTSGVLVVAKTNDALRDLQNQFKNRTVDKKYRTILSGELKDESLRIEVPIGYNPNNRVLRKATPTGQYAESTFRRQAVADERTAVWCKPVTGRTHQIRIHAKYIGHPVVGDDKYGGPGAARLMLHSEQIAFEHPETGEQTEFQVKPDEEVLELWNNITS